LVSLIDTGVAGRMTCADSHMASDFGFDHSYGLNSNHHEMHDGIILDFIDLCITQTLQ
jgi:hypothetical protein